MFETATYVVINKGQPVFEEGDKPNDKCYVILTGKCAVFKKDTMVSVKLEDDTIKQFEDDPGANIENALHEGEDKKLLRRLFHYGDMIAKKEYGTLFGETALLNDNNRNASIVALDKCELMVFHKSSLDLIKKSYSSGIAEKKIFMISLLPELSMINNPPRLAQILEYFKPIYYKKGSKVTTEGKTSNKFYFIESGEIMISKKIKMPQIVDNRYVEYTLTDTTISTLQGRGVVGEDCLEQDCKYKYTATVKSAEMSGFVCEKTNGYSDLTAFPVFPLLLKGYNLKE